MFTPADIHRWWSRYGLWAGLFLCLQCYWLGAYGPTFVGLLMPISITASAVTGLHLATERWPGTRFWRPYLVKWLSWWIANSVASAFAFSLLIFFLAVVGQTRICCLIIFVPPTIRFFIHATEDIRRLRWLRVNGGDWRTVAPV